MAASAKMRVAFDTYLASGNGVAYTTWLRAQRLDEKRWAQQEAAWAAWDTFTTAAAEKQKREMGR